MSQVGDMIHVVRYPAADAFLAAARPVLMMAEAENDLILSVAEGLARNPSAVSEPFLSTACRGDQVLACALYFSPFKLLLTGADREPITALAADAFTNVPDAPGVTGPGRSARCFADAWSKLSGGPSRLGMRMRIHETRRVVSSGPLLHAGALRPATADDAATLTAWTDVFTSEVSIQEKFDSAVVVADAIKRRRLYVWDDRGLKSMGAWTGKTPNGVRINFVYTPRELRGKGYATRLVSALTQQQLERGSAFCWLYTDLSCPTSSNLFKRIGYRPVSDVSEYYLTRA